MPEGGAPPFQDGKTSVKKDRSGHQPKGVGKILNGSWGEVLEKPEIEGEGKHHEMGGENGGNPQAFEEVSFLFRNPFRLVKQQRPIPQAGNPGHDLFRTNDVGQVVNLGGVGKEEYLQVQHSALFP
jgi:hypothetical protein